MKHEAPELNDKTGRQHIMYPVLHDISTSHDAAKRLLLPAIAADDRAAKVRWSAC